MWSAKRFLQSHRALLTGAVSLFLIFQPALSAQGTELTTLETAAAVLLREMRSKSERQQLEIQLNQHHEGYVLRELRVEVNGREWRRYRYNQAQAEALRLGAEQAIALPMHPPIAGLRVILMARPHNAPPNAPRWTAAMELAPASANGGGWQLHIQDGALPGAAPTLKWAGAPTPDATRRAAFLHASQRPFSAALQDPHALSTAGAGIDSYNDALDWQRQGEAARAEAALQALADRKGARDEDMLLRDRANLALGHLRLSRGAKAEARAALERVRSPGPHANEALLLLGWSFLQTAGPPRDAGRDQRLWGEGEAELAQLRRERPFRYFHSVAVAGERAEDLRKALVPWIELWGRDATDPAVQHALLALPYALSHLGAHAQAQRYYERAIEQLEHAHGQQREALSRVQSGGFGDQLQERLSDSVDGWRSSLASFSVPADAAILAALVPEPAFTPLWQELRRVGDIEGAVSEAQHDLGVTDEALTARAESLLLNLRAVRSDRLLRVQRLAEATIQQRLAQTQVLLAEAHFALARLHDRPLQGEGV